MKCLVVNDTFIVHKSHLRRTYKVVNVAPRVSSIMQVSIDIVKKQVAVKDVCALEYLEAKPLA